MPSFDLAALLPPSLWRLVEPLWNGRWRTAILAGGALVAALALVSLLWSWNDSYAVLYAGLSAEEGGRAIADLQKLNIAYRVAEGGRVILVPSGEIGRARLQLALRGVPRQNDDQWALLDSESLGVSPFVEQVHYVRAVESALSQTIRQVDGVVAARVELALPKQTDFLADTPKPSASVMLRLQPGVKLGAAQIAGIAGLVAAGVPGLARDNVTIVDQSGAVLAHNDKDALQQIPGQIAIARDIERRYEAAVGDLLVPVLGRENFRVSVDADIDFASVKESSITYGSNHVLSQDETVRPVSEGGAAAIGIPGALSNRPPETPTTAPTPPSTAPAIPAPPAGPAPTTAEKSATALDTHRTTNYDLDHTVQYREHPAWSVRAVNVAVLVNDPIGKAITAERVDAIKRLVSSAVGVGQNRHAEIVALPFEVAGHGIAGVAGAPADRWMTIVEQNALLALAGLFLLLGGLMPVLRRIQASQAALGPAFDGSDIPFVGMGGEPDLRQIAAQRSLAAPPGKSPAGARAFNADAETARTLVLSQPGRTAQIIKEWIARDRSRLQQAG